MPELESLLLKDLDSYLASLKARDHFVLCQRLGIGRPAETLQAVGDHLPGGRVTRERVRQIQTNIHAGWQQHMRISKEELWNNLKGNLSLMRNPIFPNLRRRFSSEAGFYGFVSMTCGLDSGHLMRIFHPRGGAETLDSFWVTHRSPAELAEATTFLMQQDGMEPVVAENLIFNLLGKGLKRTGSQIVPTQLAKPIGIANTLLDFPEGLDWRQLHQAVNRKGVTKASMSKTRIDGGIPVAVNKGWAYQHNRGAYRHTQFLNSKPATIENTLRQVTATLQKAKAEGRDALNLSVDFYQQQPQTLPYFEVRHIVRAHGAAAGVHFKGKSGADTISFSREFGLVGQQGVLLRLFKEAKTPLDKKFIASKIRSQSVGHAAFYVDELVKQGEVVRVGEDTYAYVEKAFAGLDLAAVVSAAAQLVENEPRIIEGEQLRNHLNRALGLEHNKVFYLSLLRLHAPRQGRRWHYTHNLISRSPIGFESLRDLCRSLRPRSGRREEWASRIQRRCLISQERLNIVLGALQASGRQRT